MTWVDLAVVAILALTAFGGFRRGFIFEVAVILGSIVAFAVARQEYPDVRSVIAQVAPHSTWATVIAYLVVFLIVWGAIMVVARWVRRLVRTFGLGPLDRLGGTAIGVLQGLLLVELLLYLGERVPATDIRRAVTQATLTPTLLQLIPMLHGWFPHVGA
jgi:membrane protein required for colicin V production